MILTKNGAVVVRSTADGRGNYLPNRSPGALPIPTRVRLIANIQSEEIWVDGSTITRTLGPNFLIDSYMDNTCRAAVITGSPGAWALETDGATTSRTGWPHYNTFYSECETITLQTTSGGATESFTGCLGINILNVGFVADAARGDYMAFAYLPENFFDVNLPNANFGNAGAFEVITGIVTPRRITFDITILSDAQLALSPGTTSPVFGLFGTITLVPEVCGVGTCKLGPFDPPPCVSGSGSGSGSGMDEETAICEITDCSATMPSMVTIGGDIYKVNVSGGVVSSSILVETGFSAAVQAVGGDNCGWYILGGYTPPAGAPDFYPEVERNVIDSTHCNWRIRPDVDGLTDLLDNFQATSTDVRGSYSDPPDPATVTFPSDGTYYYLKNATVS